MCACVCVRECAWVSEKEGGRERYREMQRLNFYAKTIALGFGSGSRLSCSNWARLAKSRNFRPERYSHVGTWRLMRCQRYPGCVLAIKDCVSGNMVFVLCCSQLGWKIRLCRYSHTYGRLCVAYKYHINNPTPSYLFDVAYRIGLAAALLWGWLCSEGMTACIYHKSLQISMLARSEQLALAPGAPELLLCIEWRHYHCPDLPLWHRLGLIIPCGRINSQHNSLGGDRRERRKQRE